MKRTLKDSLYAKIENVHTAYGFLQSIMQDATVYLFGGGVRDYLDDTLDISRDLDFVIESKSSKLDISKYIVDCEYVSYSKNRFGGYKIVFENNLVFDVWNLEDTWAFKTKRLQMSAENLMESVYLNIDSLVYSVNTGTYLKSCDELYSAIKRDRQIDILYDETPFEYLNLLRALVLRKKYDMLLSERLKTKLNEFYALYRSDTIKLLLELELSHYNSMILSERELQIELESANQELEKGLCSFFI